MRFGEGYAIVCSRGGGVKPCVVCGGIATKQCDYPTKPPPPRARCNAHICDGHACHVGPDLDWCEFCALRDAVVGSYP